MNEFLATASVENLQRRAEIVKRIRTFFEERLFVEVTTPVISRDTVIDRHLEPIPVASPLSDEHRLDDDAMWLQTSPEFAMKRLVASGMQAIFQIAHAFRRGEVGTFHNPEFTILEWYRVGDTLEAGVERLGEFACQLFDQPSFDVATYYDVFQQFTTIDLRTADNTELSELVAETEPSFVKSENSIDREMLVDWLWTTKVEPQLGTSVPVVITHYPIDQAALSQQTTIDGTLVAERFELYFRSIELANGYHELTDATTLEKRNRKSNCMRESDGRVSLPESSRLLEAMKAQALPDCTGVAFGVDRAVMILLGASHISDVIPFPIDRC